MKTKLSPQQRANLRVCMSCEWIFTGKGNCPKCQFASYGARYVYGNKAYRYKITQKPWLDRKIFDFTSKLLTEISESNETLSRRIIL